MDNRQRSFKNRTRSNAGIRRIAALAAALIMVICAAGEVFAEPLGENAGGGFSSGVEGGAYEVTSYDFTAVVRRDHSYTVKEVISVNIPDQLQSISFAVPSGNFRVSDMKVDGEAYNDKLQETGSVKIYDDSKLTEGTHEYTISYTISEYKDGDTSKDMFYFNVLLPEWKQPIGELSVKVSFPEDFPWDDMQFYAGQFGVQDVTNKISFRDSASKKTVSISGRLIPENFGITLKAQLPEGYWKGALDSSWALTAILIVMAGCALLLALMWVAGGRDPRIKKEPVTKPIKGLSPVELGYVFNSELGIRDILLMILYFAVRGYLTISEYQPKRYRLIKNKTPSREKRMFRNAYNVLFEDVFKGRYVDMEDLGVRLEEVRRSIYDDVAAGFTSSESSAFTPVSRVFRYAGAAVFGICLALSNAFSYVNTYRSVNYFESVFTGVLAAAASVMLCGIIDRRDSASASAGRLAELAGGIVTAAPVLYTAVNVFRQTQNIAASLAITVFSALSVFLIVIMRARGRENAEKISKLRQLRHFIYHPTARELLENHLADKNYYYDMLIYAVAFGAEESWAISFLTLDVKEPDWYKDETEGQAFSNLKVKKETTDYARDVRSFVRTVENAYSDMQRRSSRDERGKTIGVYK